MREILFRGKQVDRWEKGKWAEGHLKVFEGNAFIYVNLDTPYAIHWTQVDPETVGQFTGITDRNGKRIFEGDIIQIPDDYDEYGHNAGEIYEIYFCCGGFRLKPKYSEERGYWLADDRTVEVIGNIHDNPELLKEGVVK